MKSTENRGTEQEEQLGGIYEALSEMPECFRGSVELFIVVSLGCI